MPTNKTEEQALRDERRLAWNELAKSCPLLFQGKERFAPQCGHGWFGIIGDLCLKIEELLRAMPEAERFYEDGSFKYGVAQVKEKFGTLRFYMYWEPDGAHRLIENAEAASAKTCEACAAPGVLRRGSWIATLCDDHCDGREPYS